MYVRSWFSAFSVCGVPCLFLKETKKRERELESERAIQGDLHGQRDARLPNGHVGIGGGAGVASHFVQREGWDPGPRKKGGRFVSKAF